MSQFQSPQLPILRRIQSEKIPYIRRSKSINRSRSQSLLKNLTRKTPAIILRSKSLSKKRKSSSPIKRSSYSVINIFDDINNSFNLHNIPIYIQYIHQLYNKSTVKTLLDSTKPKSCLPSFNSKNSFFFIFRNTYNNDILGFLGLSKKGSCLYIKYLCIYDKYRNLSLGIFMGFCAVYYAEKNKINYIISYGVSDQYAESEYERNPSYAEYPDKIVLSQLLLIKKLGFIDVFKNNPDKKYRDLFFDIMMKCDNEYGETYLSLNDENKLYNDYKKSVLYNPQKIFKKYLTYLNKQSITY